MLHKTMPTLFLIMSYSFFMAIIRRVFHVYFAWKQLKADYSKNILKEKNCGHGSVSLLVGCTSVKKKKMIEKGNSVGAGVHKVGKVVSFWPNFIDIWKA